MPLVHRAKDGALRVKSKAGPAVVEGFAYIKANPQDPKVMAGLGGAALIVLIGLGALAMSAGSKKPSETDEATPASSSSAATASAALSNTTADPTSTAPGASPSSPAA